MGRFIMHLKDPIISHDSKFLGSEPKRKLTGEPWPYASSAEKLDPVAPRKRNDLDDR